MNVQSLSVVVPNAACVNDCKFCVSKMHTNNFKNQMDDNLPFFDLYLKDYMKRLEFARDNGCNTVMLTGNSEPQQNRKFLTYFGMMMQMMDNPFKWIEMQTTGVLLDRNYLRFLRNHVGVNLISLSISSFSEHLNKEYVGMKYSVADSFNLFKLCEWIKEYDFSLRLSLNLTKSFESYTPEELFESCKDMGADQVTLRILYSSGSGTPQDAWIFMNGASEEWTRNVTNYVLHYGTKLGRLPYGKVKYSLNGMSIVVDDDCMAKGNEEKEMTENYKYLILQPNCKLYSQWDDEASLIF